MFVLAFAIGALAFCCVLPALKGKHIDISFSAPGNEHSMKRVPLYVGSDGQWRDQTGQVWTHM